MAFDKAPPGCRDCTEYVSGTAGQREADMAYFVFLKDGKSPVRVPFRQVASLDAGGSVYPSGNGAVNIPVIRGQEVLVRLVGTRLWAPITEWWQFEHPDGACLQILVRDDRRTDTRGH